MAKIFYISEVIKFAIEKEQESYNLYRELAEKVSVEKLQNLFKDLMHQEKQHEAFYAKMLTTVKDEQSAGVSEDNEYVAYMRELIASSRTTKPLVKIDIENIDAVLDYAIAREKDSILFYSGLKNLVPANAHDHIDQIIGEEAKHVAILTEIKKNQHLI